MNILHYVDLFVAVCLQTRLSSSTRANQFFLLHVLIIPARYPQDRARLSRVGANQ